MSKKTCIGECGQEKELTEFYPRSQKRPGYEAQCKNCRNKAQSLRGNKKYNVQVGGNKVCKECGQCKDISEFSINRSRKDGHQGLCSICQNQADKEAQRVQTLADNGGKMYKPADPKQYDTTVEYLNQPCEVCDKVFEKVRKSHKRCEYCTWLVRDLMSHTGGSRPNYKKAPITVVIAIQLARMHIHALVCYYCGKPFSDKYGRESGKSFDHIIPVCAKGTNDPSNLVVCHLSCNRVKGTLSVEDFVILCQDIFSHMTGKTTIPLPVPIPLPNASPISPKLQAYLKAYYALDDRTGLVMSRLLPGDEEGDSTALQSKSGQCKIKGERIPYSEIKLLLSA